MGHTKRVNSIAFSSNGTRIVSGSSDKSVRLWDASTGVELKELRAHTNKKFNSVRTVRFSRDGTQIVSGSDEHSVRVWDTLTGVELKEMKGHTDCYDFKRLRQSLTVVGSKVQVLMSLEECKS